LKNERKVSFTEASAYAAERNMLFVETSAKCNIQTTEALVKLVRAIPLSELPWDELLPKLEKGQDILSEDTQPMNNYKPKSENKLEKLLSFFNKLIGKEKKSNKK
jgi:hypothetical protein